MMEEKVFPRLRIENYRVVDATGKIKVDTDEILDFFDRVSERNEKLYILDLNGFIEGTPHLDLLSEISDLVPLWVDANSKTVEDVSDILMAGAEKVVLDIGRLTLAELHKIADETLCFTLILDKNGTAKVGELYDFLKKTGVEVILRTTKEDLPLHFLRDVPVILDVTRTAENNKILREKLNIVGRIMEMDPNDL